MQTLFEVKRFVRAVFGGVIYRNVDVADESTLPDSIKNCLKLLSSDAVFLILSNMTGLKLHPLAAESDSESETEAHTSEPQAKKSKSSQDKPNGGELHFDEVIWIKVIEFLEMQLW